ncbi:MAG: hypothetical protein QG671_1430 [Actinomycetota bacterium]|nr:hypothetical protein [Actinomycetota bacterium]HQZ84412.1 hypothetical protein [Actinomycetota bacterium]
MKLPIVTAGVVTMGACCVVALAGCAELDGAPGRGPGTTASPTTSPSQSDRPSAVIPSDGGSASSATGSASAATGSAATGSAGAASATASDTGPMLDCGNVFDEAWPADMARPAAAGWDGPSCSVEEGGVVLTWAFAGGAPAPEVTDAAFVALRKGFADEGWTEQETGGEDLNGEVVTALEMESPSGRPGTISYVSGGDDPAELTVRFQG